MSESRKLAGKVAVVTGGTRGIGRSIATELLRLGATVVITGRDGERAQLVAAELSSGTEACWGLECDVSSLASVEGLGTHLRDKPGRVDILVNNAGVAAAASLLHELTPEAWDMMFDTNLRGVFYMMRAVVPLMSASGGGHIVNISSLAGKNPLPGGAAYSATKWGLNGLSYSAAEELRGNNIRVSVVCPGSVGTEFSMHVGKDPGKMLRPEDVAHVVVMLVTQREQSFVSEVLLRPAQKP